MRKATGTKVAEPEKAEHYFPPGTSLLKRNGCKHRWLGEKSDKSWKYVYNRRVRLVDQASNKDCSLTVKSTAKKPPGIYSARLCNVIIFKTDSIRKLSDFNFHWTKTLYQNILSHIPFFFTLFKGYRCN